MRVVKQEVVKEKKEWCCGKELSDNGKSIAGYFICGDWFGKDKRVICKKCLERLKDEI